MVAMRGREGGREGEEGCERRVVVFRYTTTCDGSELRRGMRLCVPVCVPVCCVKMERKEVVGREGEGSVCLAHTHCCPLRQPQKALQQRGSGKQTQERDLHR